MTYNVFGGTLNLTQSVNQSTKHEEDDDSILYSAKRSGAESTCKMNE